METKKLTCRDLMIGDWVEVNGKCIQVENVYKDMINYNPDIPYVQEEYFIEGKDITPIPLTAEILEKNGWYIPTNSCWWHNNEIDFYLVGYTNGDFGIYTDGDSEFSDLCRINHVHELQNLYRICRFNKEIVL